MKKLAFLTMMAIGALLFTSCGKEYNFVGTWGVEKIEYYNIDYAGNPIAASMETHVFNPNDTDDGIQLIFKADQTGEMRDSAIDTLGINWNDETQSYDSAIYCPDTVVVTKFTYSFDKDSRNLYMNMENMHTYRLQIDDFTDDAFIYENEYRQNFMEKAYLKRISKSEKKSATRQTTMRPRKPGSLLGGR